MKISVTKETFEEPDHQDVGCTCSEPLRQQGKNGDAGSAGKGEKAQPELIWSI